MSDPIGEFQRADAERWAREKGPNFDPYAIPPATQRIRDLEREAVGFQEELEKAHRYIDKLEDERSGELMKLRTRGMAIEHAVEIIRLEREVERVTRMAAADLLTRLHVERLAEADRADAERFRWLAMRDDIDNLLYSTADIDQVRALIDADRAKKGEQV